MTVSERTIRSGFHLLQLALEGRDLVVKIVNDTIDRTGVFPMERHAPLSRQRLVTSKTISQIVPARIRGADTAAPMHA